jgi:hypothetical protein
MKERKPYEPPKIVDLQVDYTQALGLSRCVLGSAASGQCGVGTQASSTCSTGSGFTSPPSCVNGGTTSGCNTGKTP